jgi:hypothetical protein
LPAFAFATALPAQADFCLQLIGGVFSGDLGFFRFHGKMLTVPGKIMTLRGRVAGLSPVFGTATVATDGSYVELGATFFADAKEGQIEVTLFPPIFNATAATETTVNTAPAGEVSTPASSVAPSSLSARCARERGNRFSKGQEELTARCITMFEHSAEIGAG